MAGLFAHQPDSTPRQSPFQPGSGKLPPYLAGREREQGLIRSCLDVLTQRAAPASDIILYGPRGNGKTVLIEWSRREAQALKVLVTKLQGGSIRSNEQLAAALSVERRWLGALRGFTPWPVGVRLASLPPGPVPSALARTIRKGPFLILLDEAHMLGVEPGRSLLNTVQDFRSMDLPVLLILAGTPDLPRHLGTMGASFWGRSEQLPLGRLKPTAAADAVRIPFEEHGRSVGDEALQQVVRESQNYPFFLQFWGNALWQNCSDSGMPISLDDVDRTRPLFRQRRQLYYDRRLDELHNAGLVSVAARVAATFTGTEPVLRERVTIAIRSALKREGKGKPPDPAAVREAERLLRHRGYIWPVVHRGTPCYEPGNPSLMQFVASYEEKRRQAQAEALWLRGEGTRCSAGCPQSAKLLGLGTLLCDTSQLPRQDAGRPVGRLCPHDSSFPLRTLRCLRGRSGAI